jgi:hypothetical protein
MRAGIGRLRRGFPAEKGPTAAHEVPRPLGAAYVTEDELHLIPPVVLRLLLGKAAANRSENAKPPVRELRARPAIGDPAAQAVPAIFSDTPT